MIGDMGSNGIVSYERLDCGDERCEDRTYDFLPVVVLSGSEETHWGKGWKGRVTHVGDDINRLVFVRQFERKEKTFTSRSGSKQTVRYLTDYAVVELPRLGTLQADPNEDEDACSLRIELPATWEEPDQDGDGYYVKWPFPPIYRAGVLQEDVKNLIGDNCRIPDTNWGDIKAMVAAVNSCDRRIQEMVWKFGLDTVVEGIDAVLDYTEQRARAAIRKIPAGTYRFTEYMEDDLRSEVPIRLQVALTVVPCGTSG